MGMTKTDEAVAGSSPSSEAAFAELYQRHRAMAFRTAMAILGDRGAAEEARQEAFLRAFRTLDRKDANVSFSTWLFRYVVWEARTQARKRRRPPPMIATDHGGISDLDRIELRLQLVAAMQALPLDLREVLTLRFYLDLPVEEVAQILGCRPGTVKSRSHRALGRLARSGHLAGLAGPTYTLGERGNV
jgi:RNA polymerase sigma-70 factor (ECF subfamily)